MLRQKHIFKVFSHTTPNQRNQCRATQNEYSLWQVNRKSRSINNIKIMLSFEAFSTWSMWNTIYRFITVETDAHKSQNQF